MTTYAPELWAYPRPRYLAADGSDEAMDAGFVGFEEFAALETPRLLRVAYGLTGNPHDAWDLVQEALVRVGTRWRRLRDQNPGGYAQTVLVRLNIDRHRRLRREVPSASATDLTADGDHPVTLDQALDPQLVEALAALSPRQRAAVVLRTIEDLDHAAIAARLGCSEATARTHLMRGLARMRDELTRQEADDRAR